MAICASYTTLGTRAGFLRGPLLDRCLLFFSDDRGGFENVLLMAEFVFGTLFMSLITVMVRAVDCVYPGDRTIAPYLRSMASMECWGSEHKACAVVSLVFMTFFLEKSHRQRPETNHSQPLQSALREDNESSRGFPS
jgi:hypothetical protein